MSLYNITDMLLSYNCVITLFFRIQRMCALFKLCVLAYFSIVGVLLDLYYKGSITDPLFRTNSLKNEKY